MPVYPGVTQVVYDDAPVTAGYMPVAPRLRLGVTLHYKTRVKTWNNIFCLYRITVMSSKKKTSNRHKGSLTVWALYAYFSDSQDAAFELLVWCM